MQIYIAGTQGFCSGVSFAIRIVEEALKKYDLPVFVLHEIVHNTHVVNDFKKRGVVFVEKLSDVPENNLVILSAHGAPPSVYEEAEKRKIKVIDATCPLVNKVHNEAKKYSKENYAVILIGHKKHQETVGTAGYVDKELLHIVESEKDIEGLTIPKNTKIAYITQTTLSVDDVKDLIASLRKKFPGMIKKDATDICYATQNRQDAVKELSKLCDVIIICGSPNSSNSNRLRETGEKTGKPSYIIDSAQELDLNVLDRKEKVGISSGASVPRFVVDDVVEKIKTRFKDAELIFMENREKNITFKLPLI
ncbi:MAG: 4-hydroxy-3-methylbut-2-enyl diphosphate reductase [Candidatus Omnitrophica bacterium]|nr:4-hydroxy-3-methylbut-2-enyl diphosphate reductase [Candidatus Omnitrophota bacterium]